MGASNDSRRQEATNKKDLQELWLKNMGLNDYSVVFVCHSPSQLFVCHNPRQLFVCQTPSSFFVVTNLCIYLFATTLGS